MRSSTFTTLSLLTTLACADWWHPTAGTTWQIVLLDPLTPPYPANITAIDGDLFSNNASTWTSLSSQGYKTICYFSAGSFEDWRPDASKFNHSTDIGSPLQGWRHEWWVNTTSPNVRSIMSARLDLAKSMGCDAVDPDNIDAYENGGGGIGLTQDDAVDYISFLSTEAHNRNMSMGLKNGGAIVSRVLSMVDFEINEQCNTYNECNLYQPFIQANKPVFGIEYTNDIDSCKHSPDKFFPDATSSEVQDVCNDPQSAGFSTVIKHMTLDAWTIECNVTASGTMNGTRTGSAPMPTVSDGAASRMSIGGGVGFMIVAVVGGLFL